MSDLFGQKITLIAYPTIQDLQLPSFHGVV